MVKALRGGKKTKQVLHASPRLTPHKHWQLDKQPCLKSNSAKKKKKKRGGCPANLPSRGATSIGHEGMVKTLIRASQSHTCLNKELGPCWAACSSDQQGQRRSRGKHTGPELSSPPHRGTLAKVKTAKHPTLCGSHPDLPADTALSIPQFSCKHNAFLFHFRLPTPHQHKIKKTLRQHLPLP